MDDNKKKSRVSFWISTSLAIFFFLCSIFMFFLLMGTLFVKGAFLRQVEKDKKFTEKIVEGTGVDKIVIIPVKGLITAQSSKKFLYETPSVVESVKKQLEQAGDDNDVRAVILEVDSPGGGITASDIIHKEILEFKERTNKNVIVSMQDIAASGAYYVSAAADTIISHPTTVTGSIGVIVPLINIAELIERYGIEDNSIKSGKMKSIGSPLKKMSDEEREVLIEIVDEMYTRFLKIISEGRDMEIEDVRKLADGRIYTGNQALDNGLVDRLGYIEDAITVAKEMTGLTEATVIKYKRIFTISEIFAGSMSEMLGDRIVNIGINTPAGEEDFPRFMYLWTGYQQNNFLRWPTFN